MIQEANIPMFFSLSLPTKIHFGRGTARNIGGIVSDLGCNALVISGNDVSRVNEIRSCLEKHKIRHAFFPQIGEPTIDEVERGATLAVELGVDLVIAVGGGSVMDAGKAIAALAVNPGAAMNYLEVIGEGQPLIRPPLPLVVVPTTAGTGAEVTFNSVLASPEHGVKVSLRSPLMAPDVAIVDPELSMTMPAFVTAASGMDALTQLVEAFISVAANPLTDVLCREGIKRVGLSLKAAHDNGTNLSAREDMSLAALFSGIALANAKLGVVHAIAGPMGGMIPGPHGAICAQLLGPCMALNLAQSRCSCDDAENFVETKLGEVACLLTQNCTSKAEDAIEWINEMTDYLLLPSLSHYGLTKDHCKKLSKQALKSSSMKGNPILLTEEKLLALLSRYV